MKKTLLILFVSIVCGCQKDFIAEEFGGDKNKLTTRSSIDEDYYYGSNGKIPIIKSTTQSFVVFRGESADLQKSTRGVSITAIRDVKEYHLASASRKTRGASVSQGLKYGVGEVNDISTLTTFDNVVYAAPYYTLGDGEEYPLTNVFYVELKTTDNQVEMERLAAEHNVIISGKIYPTWDAYTLFCTKDSSGNALEMANLFYDTGLFSFSHPEFLSITLDCVNDEYFPEQWNFKNTGQHIGVSGLDINYCNSRTISTGSENITVAVIDTGVDAEHPDLNISHTHDAATQTDISVRHSNLGQAYHGTSCIGIINAQANNNIGIAGIAPDCNLMSISSKMTDDECAYALLYASDHGADVISCSWSSPADVPVINYAVNYALTEGRHRKGCVVVFSSGSRNGSVRYPGAAISNIIVVGAVKTTGARADYSAYGDALDVVAPGEFIFTTDILRSNGGFGPVGDPDGYYPDFGGTSAAVPHVAGVAALILSENPEIPQKQVAKIIEQSARKSGSYPYSTYPERPHGKWYKETGYGLVNAYAALQGAQSYYNYFKDKIVAGHTAIIYSQSVDWGAVWVENVIVRSGGSLELRAPTVIVDAPFTIEAGATFIMGE